MLPAGLLTSDDLDEIGLAAFGAEDPLEVAAELVEVVEQDRLADAADAGYALGLAAGITAREGGLVKTGHAEVAERWLTTAVKQALDHRQALEPERPQPAYARAAEIAFQLLQSRHRVRGDLGLPHDAHDDLADQLADVVDEALDEEARQPLAVLYWPAHEFTQLLQRWPTLGEVYGQSWDEHRRMVELVLTAESESGRAQLGVCAGSVDDLVDFGNRHGGDPVDEHVRQRYAEHAAARVPKVAWPPSRNDTCWCGSGSKYKKCCRPRSRTFACEGSTR